MKQIVSPLLPEDPNNNYLLQRKMKPENDILTRQQVNQCLMDIEDAHPLRREALLEDVWPCLRFVLFYKKQKPDFRKALRNCLHKELGIVVSRSGYAYTATEEKEFFDNFINSARSRQTSHRSLKSQRNSVMSHSNQQNRESVIQEEDEVTVWVNPFL